MEAYIEASIEENYWPMRPITEDVKEGVLEVEAAEEAKNGCYRCKG